MPRSTENEPKWSSQIFGQIIGHPLSWLTMTLAVVLAAYIWMESITNEIPSAPVKKLSPQAASNNLDQIELLVKQETMTISNANDKARAEEYLAEESRESSINPLMLAARKHIENNQFSLPPGDNAWNDYQQVLIIAPENSKAKTGLIKVRNKLIDNAETAIEAGDFANAENWLVQLDEIQPESTIQTDLRADIKSQIALEAQAKLRQQKEKERLLKIENSLSQASVEETNIPINYNKIKDLYLRVLELDSENPRALAGLEMLIETLLDDADRSLRANNYSVSQHLLNNVEDIEPENKRLSSLRLALDTRLEQQKEKQLAEAIRLKNKARTSKTPAKAASTSAPSNNRYADKDSRSTIVAQASAKEIAEKRKNDLIQSGIRAYYEGDYNKSFEVLYPLAEEGVSRAQFRIGVMYKYGRSVSKNEDLSEKWFTRALPAILRLAQQGVPWAQTDLGTSYELGISLKQDFERAAHWYRLAANQGYPGAQTNLGVLYANGEGVNYSRSQAVFWLKKAARQGDLVAQENLKIMGATL